MNNSTFLTLKTLLLSQKSKDNNLALFKGSDYNLLKKWGHRPDEFSQLQEAAYNTLYTLEIGDYQPIKLTPNQAIHRLGRKRWLSGISRCAFHFTSCREDRWIKDGSVFFDFKII